MMCAAIGLENSVARGLVLLSLAITLGLFLGSVRIRGMRLGVAGVLFAAIIFGQSGLTVEPAALRFIRDFSLIVFIYCLGLQVGPGFISSLRSEGLRLNAMAVAVLVLGALMTAAIVHVTHTQNNATSGIYAGAFTTTPGLAAGQDALTQRLSKSPGLAPDAIEQAMRTAALAYSVGYPFGVIGPILVIIMLRRFFRISLSAEREKLIAAEEARRPPIETADFEVTDSAHAGQSLSKHPLVRTHGVIFSRLVRDGVLSVPTGDTVVQVGDVYRAVGPRTALAELVSILGRPAAIDLGQASGDVERVELVVTRTQVLRRSLRELDLIRRLGVTIARINRAGVDLVPKASLRLAFADRIIAVGPKNALKQVEAEVGNCPETLNRPQLIPIFVGIVCGVLVGSIALPIPGLGITLKIGLAGGPLLAALALSQLGNLGSVVWYMPTAANALLRDFGLAVFLACVGLEAGDQLIQQVLYRGGLVLALWAALVTVMPVLIVGALGRWVYKINFITLSGWVAGAMTSSPALAFANDMADSNAPAISYAAVAPLATLVPILCAQLLGAA